MDSKIPLSSKNLPEISQLGQMQNLPAFQTMLQFIKAAGGKFNDEHAKICEIPAPPFQEQARADYFLQRFSELGLESVQQDSSGNVIGIYPGTENSSYVCLSAHLDTVFPPQTNLKVQKFSTKMYAPGIGDNAAGLAALLAFIEILKAGKIIPKKSILLVATVGEEGEGDLRGVRHLFTEGEFAERISHFISLDGPGNDFITHQALGSRRYRIMLVGPGGHSWTDFGVVNPVHAISRAVARLAEFPVPWEPRTTYNVGKIIGGESINVIPESASIDVDIRSTDEREISRVEDYLLSVVNQAVRAENSLRAAAHYTLKIEVNLIGHRPSGETPRESMLVQLALESARAVGIKAYLNCASTDANIPISLGIPAITIGAGGVGGDAHRLTEWYEPTGRDNGYKRLLLLILGLTGVN